MKFTRFLSLILVTSFCVSCSDDDTVDGSVIDDALQNAGIEVDPEEIQEVIDQVVSDPEVKPAEEIERPTGTPSPTARRLQDEFDKAYETAKASTDRIFSSIKTGDIASLKEEYAKLDEFDNVVVTIVNKNSDTPLIAAVRAGQDEIVDFLASNIYGNVNAQNGLGYTPLTWAALEGNVYATQRLLAHPNINPNITDMNGRTPLIWSVNIQALENNPKDRFKVLELLLNSEKVNPNIKDTYHGRSALAYAVELNKKDSSEGRLDVVKAVLNSKNRLDTSIEDNYGLTASDLAKFKNKTTILEVLNSHK